MVKKKKDKVIYLFEGELVRYELRSSSTYPILYKGRTKIEVCYKKTTGEVFVNDIYLACIPFVCEKCNKKNSIKFKDYLIEEGHDGNAVQVSRWIDLVLKFQCANCLKRYEKRVEASKDTKIINAYYPDYNLSAIQFNI